MTGAGGADRHSPPAQSSSPSSPEFAGQFQPFQPCRAVLLDGTLVHGVALVFNLQGSASAGHGNYAPRPASASHARPISWAKRDDENEPQARFLVPFSVIKPGSPEPARGRNEDREASVPSDKFVAVHRAWMLETRHRQVDVSRPRRQGLRATAPRRSTVASIWVGSVDRPCAVASAVAMSMHHWRPASVCHWQRRSPDRRGGHRSGNCGESPVGQRRGCIEFREVSPRPGNRSAPSSTLAASA